MKLSPQFEDRFTVLVLRDKCLEINGRILGSWKTIARDIPESVADNLVLAFKARGRRAVKGIAHPINLPSLGIRAT